MKKYKIVTDDTLWEVTLCAEYSELDDNTYLFSGNSVSDVWERVKIFASNGGLDTETSTEIINWDTQEKFEFSKERHSYLHTPPLTVEIEKVHIVHVNK